jgi:hypothetical protein
MLMALAAALLSAPQSARAEGLFESELENPFGVALNFGVGGFVGQPVRDVTTNFGPAYGVMGAFNKNPIWSLELGYIGHTNGIDTTDRRLSTNKIQADVKAGLPLQAPVAWKPYLFAGLAADFVTSSTEAFGLSSAIQPAIPIGAGVDFFTDKAFQVGARGTYDITPGIGGSVSPMQAHPDSWQAVLQGSAYF